MALFRDGANGVTAATVSAAPVVAAKAEVEVDGVVAAVLAQRAGPVAAVRATADELLLVVVVAVARSGKEDRVTVRTSDLITVDAV